MIRILNIITRTCQHHDSQHRRCALPYGHATGHQWHPTLREWWAGWIYQGREGTPEQ